MTKYPDEKKGVVMQLTISDVAKHLNVSQRTIYRWINQGLIPAYKVNEQYRFSHSELLEWISKRKVTVSREFFDMEEVPGRHCSVASAIRNGGIHYRIGGASKRDVIANSVSVMNLPEGLDRSYLVEILLAREDMASTGVGGGIAIPHVRNPVVLSVEDPYIGLCFLEKPVEFGALDGKKVFCLFNMVSPSPRVHLKLISRLAFILRQGEVSGALERIPVRDEIMNAIEAAERSVLKKER